MKKIILSILLLQSNYNMELDSKVEFKENPEKLSTFAIPIKKNTIRLDLFFLNNKVKFNEQQLISQLTKYEEIDTMKIIDILNTTLEGSSFAFIPRVEKRVDSVVDLLKYHFFEKEEYLCYFEPNTIQDTNIKQETLHIVSSQEMKSSDVLRLLFLIYLSKKPNTINTFSEQYISGNQKEIPHNKFSNIIFYLKDHNTISQIEPLKEINNIYIKIKLQQIFLSVIISKKWDNYIVKNRILELVNPSLEKIYQMNIVSKIDEKYCTAIRNSKGTVTNEAKNYIIEQAVDTLSTEEQNVWNNMLTEKPCKAYINKLYNHLSSDVNDSDVQYFIQNQSENIDKFLQHIDNFSKKNQQQ